MIIAIGNFISRQPKGEGAAFADFALDGDFAPQTFRQMFGYAQAQPEPKLLPAAGLVLRCVLVGRSQDEAEFRSIGFGQAFQNRLQVNHLAHHRLAQSNFSTQCQILVRIGEGFARRKSRR
jgi:hypothetical protein